ncbi:hypothetical protein L210DRAFT_3646353 [Boletus edulis BED1]|uniref:Uncharacterized protein n=1 Tax=Boletus edulis BED1 TaxID=1328754 RepID=A0AAD4GE23_BOLED|nr:hypothetical protein L210DRAFT_3646353 [Boletus edulis BED1]
MSDHAAQSSETESSHLDDRRTQTDLPQQALDLVEQYRQDQISKAEAILAIQTQIQSHEMDHSTSERAKALTVYVAMLDEVDALGRETQGSTHRNQSSESSPFGGSHWTQDRSDDESLNIHGSHSSARSRSTTSTEADEERVSKRKRLPVNESKFPWHLSSSFRRLQLQPDQQRILDLLEDWASDPTYIIQKILLSPGCPDFPPDQWLNIVKGQAVDLSKVLGAHYSTEVETKQSHDLRELFQVSVRLPKQSKAIKSHGDWVIAFGKTIQATAYALPPRHRDPSTMIESLSSTKQSDSMRPIKNTYTSMILPPTTISEPSFCPHMVWVPTPKKELQAVQEGVDGSFQIQGAKIPATIGIEEPVTAPQLNVNMNMSVIGEHAGDHIRDQIAQSLKLNNHLSEHPKFKCQFIWGSQPALISRTVRWTEHAAPLPSPPSTEFENVAALATIGARPDLFQVSTPIDICRFESLLADHPNQPFVKSNGRSFGTTLSIPLSESEATFLREQVQTEVDKGRYSPVFGPDLLPEMYSMPIHAVPKPGMGNFALEDIAGVTLDNAQDLGNALRFIHQHDPDADLILWKADVSEAY